MPDTAEPPDLAAPIRNAITRLTLLRDDVRIFGLERQGITQALNDVIQDLQVARKRAGQ